MKNVTEDKTVYAIYTATVRTYTITYYDSDGATVLKTETLAYGAMPSYEPVKNGALFTGWMPALETVIGDATYTASWVDRHPEEEDGYAEHRDEGVAEHVLRFFPYGHGRIHQDAAHEGSKEDVEAEFGNIGYQRALLR